MNARSGHDSTVPFDHSVVETGTATGGSTTTLVSIGAGLAAGTALWLLIRALKKPKKA
jgi:hypothetical protein